jgi:hypothetical protein
MKVINNYNLLRKITTKEKFLVNNNLSSSNKLRRDFREKMKVVTVKRILKNTKVNHNLVRPLRFLRRKN